MVKRLTKAERQEKRDRINRVAAWRIPTDPAVSAELERLRAEALASSEELITALILSEEC